MHLLHIMFVLWGSSYSCHYDTFTIDWQWLWNLTIKFARWQHPTMECEVRFALPKGPFIAMRLNLTSSWVELRHYRHPHLGHDVQNCVTIDTLTWVTTFRTDRWQLFTLWTCQQLDVELSWVASTQLNSRRVELCRYKWAFTPVLCSRAFSANSVGWVQDNRLAFEMTLPCHCQFFINNCRKSYKRGKPGSWPLPQLYESVPMSWRSCIEILE